MAHPAKQLAEQIKTSIAGGSFSMPLTRVARAYSPRMFREDLKAGEVDVLVAPKSLRSNGLLNRETSEEFTGIDVGVVAKFDGTVEKFDELMDLAYEIQTHVIAQFFSKFNAPMTNDPIYDRENYERKEFLSITNFEFDSDRTF